MAAYVYTVVFGKVFFQYVVLYLFGSVSKFLGLLFFIYFVIGAALLHVQESIITILL
jgi:hypothetical protein